MKQRGSFQLRGSCASGVEKHGEIAPEDQALGKIIQLASEREEVCIACENVYQLPLPTSPNTSEEPTGPKPFSENRQL